jgi:Zn-dependent peptidase ImmA (M78 family)
MSVRWERLAGDTSRFAVKLAFHSDPDELPVIDPEVGASWGALQLWVDGINVCANIDQGEVLQSVHWYMLPLLEWLVQNWDPILHEERPPLPSQHFRIGADDDVAFPSALEGLPFEPPSLDRDNSVFAWRQRHALRSARDGGVFPDVYLRRLRGAIEVSWANAQLPGATDVTFVSSEGYSYQDPTPVATALFDVVADATNWLAEQTNASERIHSLSAAVEGLRTGGGGDRRMAWLAGLGRVGAEVVNRWQRLSQSARSMASERAFEASFLPAQASNLVISGSCQAALLFGSVSPTIDEEDALKLVKLLLDRFEAGPRDLLDDIVENAPPDPTSRARNEGYALAEQLLDQLGQVEEQEWFDIEHFLQDREVLVTEVELSDQSVRAVSFVGPVHKPTIALNTGSRFSRSYHARRFSLAHELCHLLHDRDLGAQLAVASGPWAPQVIEQRANAFAAMLLMSPDLLRSAIANSKDGMSSIDGARSVARGLHVSVSAVIEHASNLGFIDLDARDILRADTQTSDYG